MLNYNQSLRPFLKDLETIDGELTRLGRSKNEKYFGYIPVCKSAELIGYLAEDPTRKFLDIGSGSGAILALRKYLTGNEEVYGIEINKEIALARAKEFDLDPKKIKIGDAFNILTAAFLRKFNTVYTYMPISDAKLMLKLERQIEDQITFYVTRIEMYPVYFPYEIKHRFTLKPIQRWD